MSTQFPNNSPSESTTSRNNNACIRSGTRSISCPTIESPTGRQMPRSIDSTVIPRHATNINSNEGSKSSTSLQADSAASSESRDLCYSRLYHVVVFLSLSGTLPETSTSRICHSPRWVIYSDHQIRVLTCGYSLSDHSGLSRCEDAILQLATIAT
jgi:hypothetical protein